MRVLAPGGGGRGGGGEDCNRRNPLFITGCTGGLSHLIATLARDSQRRRDEFVKA